MIRGRRWQEVKQLVAAALDLAGTERRAYLDRACGNDQVLRRQVDSFLETHERIGDFIARPIFSLRAEEEAPRQGERIGRYRLLRELGRGGMGTVYLAERADGEFEARVAVKLLKRGMDTDEVVARFQAERQILARLEHPYVARLLDGGTTSDGRPYFVMEHVAGEPIDVYCDACALPIRQRLELFRKVCSAVGFAHRNLVVHRDLKPSNILVTPEGTPKLLDFGIAKLLKGDPRATCTSASWEQSPMTPVYASPEQVKGEPITTATDVYALGVLLYEVLTGRRPYRFATLEPKHVGRVICEEPPERPSRAAARPEEVGEVKKRRRQLAGDLDNIVLKALHKEPERRFASAEQLSEDLRRHLEGEPVRSRPDTFLYRTGKFLRRHAVGVATAAAVFLLVLGFAVAMAAQRDRIARQSVVIRLERDRAQAARDFLVTFLKSPDPRRSHGADLTVREALESALLHLDEELGDEPVLRADVLDMIGRVYQNLALYPVAEEYHEEALALRRAHLGGDDPLVAASLLHLGHTRLSLGKDDLAEQHYREALAIQRRAFPEGHRQLARGLNNFALHLRKKGRLDEAEALAREALAMKKRLLGDEDEDVTVSLNTLGMVLRDQGRLAEAEALLRECLERRRRLWGDEDPRLANTLTGLGMVLLRREEPDAAEPFLREALDIRRRVYHEDHPHLVSSFRALAELAILRGDYEAARDELEQALAMQRRLTGEDHPDTVQIGTELSSVSAKLDRS